MADLTDDLEDRVMQFRAFELPGQPKSTNPATAYLVRDLWREVQRLRAIPKKTKRNPRSGETGG